MIAYGLEGAAVVGLQPQEIVGTLRPDPRGDVLLTAHGIERHDGAVEMQGVEQLGDGGDLVRLAVDLALTEHQSLITGPGTDQMQRAVIVAGRLPERRTVLPSTATTSRSTLPVKDCAHRTKQPSNASGSISMKTRRNVSCEGMPFGRARKVFSQACLLRP